MDNAVGGDLARWLKRRLGLLIRARRTLPQQFRGLGHYLTWLVQSRGTHSHAYVPADPALNGILGAAALASGLSLAEVAAPQRIRALMDRVSAAMAAQRTRATALPLDPDLPLGKHLFYAVAVHILQPRRICELGTYLGQGAAVLAAACDPAATSITTVDRSFYPGDLTEGGLTPVEKVSLDVSSPEFAGWLRSGGFDFVIYDVTVDDRLEENVLRAALDGGARYVCANWHATGVLFGLAAEYGYNYLAVVIPSATHWPHPVTIASPLHRPAPFTGAKALSVRSFPMGSTRIVAGAALLIAVLTVAGAAAAATARELYYERFVMLEANERCRLFTPEAAAALSASGLQARGAALRAGASAEQLAAVADRAKLAAYSVACASPDLRKATDRVKDAFAGLARTTWMNFPGETATWRAERRPTPPVVNHKPVDGPVWRLAETGRWIGMGGPPPILGLTSDLSLPLVLAPVAEASAASSAFLIVRDADKSSGPYLPPGARDLAARAPPRAITRAFVARSKDAAPASLLDRGRGAGTLFGFPAGAVRALEALDPREVIVMEISYSGRAPLRAVFEAGDFAAGRAFLAVK